MLQGVLLPQVYVIHAAYQSFVKRHMFIGIGSLFVYDSGMKIVANHETKTKLLLRILACVPPISPPTLHTTLTYGLIPFQNTSNQTKNV